MSALVSIAISSFSEVIENGKAYTVYVINIRLGGYYWSIYRRYSAFKKLSDQVRPLSYLTCCRYLCGMALLTPEGAVMHLWPALPRLATPYSISGSPCFPGPHSCAFNVFYTIFSLF